MRAKPHSIKEACVAEAFRIIEEKGPENLSMRDVARRLGISHQAPYKHFQSREHILAAVIGRVFEEFAAYLDERPRHADPFLDLRAMGERYLTYARENPLKYRLMFNTALPKHDATGDMTGKACRAFAILEDRLADMPLSVVGAGPDARLDAFFIWSTLHGLASIAQSDARISLEMPPGEMARAEARIFDRLGAAIAPTRD